MKIIILIGNMQMPIFLRSLNNMIMDSNKDILENLHLKQVENAINRKLLLKKYDYNYIFTKKKASALTIEQLHNKMKDT